MERKCPIPVRAALLGGLVAFAWSAVSWMVLPFHNRTVHQLADAAPLVNALAGNGSGVYLLMNDAKGQTAPTDPFLFISYRRQGSGSMARMMVLGALVQILGAFFFGMILSRVPDLTPKRGALHGLAFGLAAGMVGAMPNAIWWGFPLDFTLATAADFAAAWTLAGAAMAKWGYSRSSATELSSIR